jgi:capsular polysaccharide biosynthesis protein
MDIRSLLRLIIRNIWIVLLVTVITVVATLIYTNRQPVVYSARATFVARLNESLMDDRSSTGALDLLSRSSEISTTYSEVAKSRRIKFFAGERLGLDPATRADMSVDSRVVPGTNIIEITAEGAVPEQARDYANAVGQETISYVRSLYPAYELVPLDEAITPFDPARPNKTFNLALGVLAGLLLGVGMAFLATSLSSEKIEEEQEAEPDTPQMDGEIQKLRQELALYHMQFERTQQQLEQTKEALSGIQQGTVTTQVPVNPVTAMGNHQSGEPAEG